MYTADLSEVVMKQHDVNIHVFADDTQCTSIALVTKWRLPLRVWNDVSVICQPLDVSEPPQAES